MPPWALTLLTAGVALISAVVTSTINTWLGSREKVNEELRVERLKVYPEIWTRTKLFSRWPWTAATYDDLANFQRGLCAWYFEVGGLYMSENSRARYGDVQKLTAALLDHGLPGSTPVGDAYADVMDACSAFRTGLTEDLESRRQRSLMWSLQKAREHRRFEREGEARVERARKRVDPSTRVRTLRGNKC